MGVGGSGGMGGRGGFGEGGGCFMIKIPLKMNRHKKNQIEIKIDNFSQKGLSSSGEILRSTFSMIKKKSTVVG